MSTPRREVLPKKNKRKKNQIQKMQNTIEKGSAKKVEASANCGGIEILNSWPAFQTNVPSRGRNPQLCKIEQFVPPSNQLPVHSVQPNQPTQSVLQNQLPVQPTPHLNQLSIPSTPPSKQLPIYPIPTNQPIQSVVQNRIPVHKWWNRELTMKCKFKSYVKSMKDPLSVSPSKGNQGTTRGKEKILLTSVGIEPTTSALDLPLLY